MNETTYSSLVVHQQSPTSGTPSVGLDIPGRYLIGTDPNAVVRLPANANASALHALLIVEPATIRLQDLATPAGTFVNGRKIDTAELSDGDEVRCGSISLRISVQAVAPSPVATTILVPAPPAADPVPEIQGFTELTQIGRGALGTVYRARQLGSNRVVAIKCIRPELQSDERTRSLFIREAAISARLKHPRIVECLDFGLTKDHPYLVMEYLPSESLEAIAWRHDPERRVRLAVKAVLRLLEALEYAHGEGVVHRDVKPSNVLASTSGGRLRLKLSDFGLAKVFNTAGYSGITPSNEICGTLAYMSPEQLLDSRSAKPDADVYAAVVCLFRLLTEQFPHPEGSPVQTIQRRLHDDPRPVRTFNSHVPAELARIVDRGLSRTREQRYAAAGELHAALSSLTLLRQEHR